MAAQDAFTPEEWKAVSEAPVMAGMLVTFADMSSPVGVIQEAAAMTKAITSPAAASGEIAMAIGVALKERRKLDMPDIPKNREGAKSALEAGVRRGADLVTEKSPAEADGYKVWLLTVAKAVADAAKEGTFLGFGGTPVSKDETAALDELATMLGVASAP